MPVFLFGFINLCSGNTRSNSSIFWYSFSSNFIYLVDLCYTFEYCIFFKMRFCVWMVFIIMWVLCFYFFKIIDLIRFSFFIKNFLLVKNSSMPFSNWVLLENDYFLFFFLSISILCISVLFYLSKKKKNTHTHTVLFQIQSAAWEWFIIFYNYPLYLCPLPILDLLSAYTKIFLEAT